MSLADILHKRASEIEAPKPIPMGHYNARVMSIGKFTQVGQDKKDVVDFDIHLISAQDDVDPDALRELPQSIVGRKMSVRFFLTDEDAAYYLKEDFLTKLGLDMDASIAELCNSTNGKDIVVKITHRSFTPEGQTIPQIRAEIDRKGFIAA